MELTREEQYLAYLSGTGTALPEPITRNERYLYNLCKKNGTGGAKTWDDLGYSPTGGDTLTWDGNTAGLVTDSTGSFFKVSSSTPTESDFSNGFSVTSFNGTIQEATPDMVSELISALGSVTLGPEAMFVVVYESATVEDLEATFTEPGIYLMSIGEWTITSLTIPGYTGFPSVNKVPEEYLPGLKLLGDITLNTTNCTVSGNELAYNDEVAAQVSTMFYACSNASGVLLAHVELGNTKIKTTASYTSVASTSLEHIKFALVEDAIEGTVYYYSIQRHSVHTNNTSLIQAVSGGYSLNIKVYES